MSTTEKKKKNYIKGSAKEHKFANGGTVIHVDILLNDLIAKVKPNEAGYVKLTVSKLPNVDNYGNTHTVYENEWRPAPKGAEAPKQKPATYKGNKDEFPF